MDCTDYDRIIDGDDDFGFECEKRPARIPSPGEMLSRRFEEINHHYETVGSEPRADLPPWTPDAVEKVLSARLSVFRSDAEIRGRIVHLDRHGLLGDAAGEDHSAGFSYDDIIAEDPLGLAPEVAGADGIFSLRHVPASPSSPETVAERVPCADFALFEPLFGACRRQLVDGMTRAIPFANEQDIGEGDFFVLNGLLVYVAERTEEQLRTTRRRMDARLRCIVENGTEYRPLLRSLARSLYRDDSGRRVVSVQRPVEEARPLDPSRAGKVYVLRSLSTDRSISGIRDLYKIGYTEGSVEGRIRNARSEPTYLMAPVAVEGVIEMSGISPEGFEALVHRFFGEVCLDVRIEMPDGTFRRPKEWFIVPLGVIRQAVSMIADRTITGYRYDMGARKIVPLEAATEGPPASATGEPVRREGRGAA